MADLLRRRNRVKRRGPVTDGRRVRVLSARRDRDLGAGVLAHYRDITGAPLVGLRTPEIWLDSGRLIYGYECWWTEVDRG